ncbi:DUF6233 domain-containing protein [Streptomyces collinus]|uniref:DUF6233 domain-containing protein n=1 Tax=Streptomyces collinus TaxID=42684 RepID=UPI0036F0DB8B
MDQQASRLDMLRFARRVVLQQTTAALAQLDGCIAAEERREAERRRGEERRPPQPERLIQHGFNRSNIDAVHTGDCWAAAKSGRCGAATREQALDALRRQVPPCVHCRPDTALGTPGKDGGRQRSARRPNGNCRRTCRRPRSQRSCKNFAWAAQGERRVGGCGAKSSTALEPLLVECHLEIFRTRDAHLGRITLYACSNFTVYAL